MHLEEGMQRSFNSWGKAQGQPCHDETQHCVYPEEKANAGSKGEADTRQWTGQSRRQRPYRCAERSDQIVAGEKGCPALGYRDLREHRLVDREKGGSLRGRCAKRAEECC